jgi:hypothetical protein
VHQPRVVVVPRAAIVVYSTTTTTNTTMLRRPGRAVEVEHVSADALLDPLH